MAYLIGVGLALAVSLMSRIVGLDRDRTLYPAMMIVIASTYDLFAIMSGSMPALGTESVVAAAFLLFSILGFRFNLWFVVGALFAHGVFDFFHARFISNPGVPVWWPSFCLTYDITAAGYLAWLLLSSRVAAKGS